MILRFRRDASNLTNFHLGGQSTHNVMTKAATMTSTTVRDTPLDDENDDIFLPDNIPLEISPSVTLPPAPVC
jgi:hypothetical protein